MLKRLFCPIYAINLMFVNYILIVTLYNSGKLQT